MVVHCSVAGCTNRQGGRSGSRSDNDDTELSDIRFFRVPAVKKRGSAAVQKLQEEQRNSWFAALNRKDVGKLNPDSIRICSEHFITGAPAYFQDTNNPDWRPTLRLGYSKKKYSPSPSTKLRKYERMVNRSRAQKKLQYEDTTPPVSEDNVEADLKIPELDDNHLLARIASLEAELKAGEITRNGLNERIASLEVELKAQEIARSGLNERIASLEVELKEGTIIRNDLNKRIASQDAELRSRNAEVYELRRTVQRLGLEEPAFENDDRRMRYFSGVPNVGVFKLILSYLDTSLNGITGAGGRITNFQKMLICFMKLRFNTSYRGLAYRFNIREKTASEIFKKVLVLIDHTFSHLVHWPDREAMRTLTPPCFQRNFGKGVTVIIDCFEIAIEKPSNLKGKAQTYSDYKSKNTVKYELGITPHGFVSFISKGYGGRISDRNLTEVCGILDNLIPGDVMLADRGFTIYDLVGARLAQLRIPDFTKGKSQLLPREVENTRSIAEVRIHVERVIGLMRNKFGILKGPLSIKLFQSTHEGRNLVDCIVHVCCIIANMVESIVNV